MTISLSGKTALVTGASKGIGAAAALALSEARAKVAICARNEDELRQTAADIETRTGHRVVAVRADVSVQADVDRLVQEVERRWAGSISLSIMRGE
jgi:3-oxoacyl-[acyl-carrier protein] reductase